MYLSHRDQSRHQSLKNLIDVSDTTGYIKDYDGLLVATRDLVEMKEHDMFFHKDAHNEYTLHGTSLHDRAIYGRSEGRKEGEGIGARVTTRNLTPIQTNDTFKRVVAETGEAVCKKPAASRSSRRPKASEKTRKK